MSSVTPSAQFRLTIRVELDETAGTLAHLTAAIGEADGIVVAVDAVEIDSGHSVRDIVVDAAARTTGSRSSPRSARSTARA